jgi:hypothetical protein
MSEILDSEAIRNKLVTYTEPQLRYLLTNFFNKIGFANYFHGNIEHGADIELILPERDDPIGIGQVCFFQVKSGNIDNNIWRATLCGQMVELMIRPVTTPNISEYLARRIVLVTSGKITPSVVTSINNWNKRIQVPIEVLDGHKLANLLARSNYSASMMDTEVLGELPLPVGSQQKISSRKRVGQK